MLIRALSDSDIPAMMLIEQAVQVSPWSEQMFRDSLAHHDLGWCLIDDRAQLRAYILIKPAVDQADILTIAVDPAHQRKGYAQALMNFLLTQQPRTLYLEVRVSNQAAIALYEKTGFKKTGRRPKYYQDEDAWVMKKE